MPFSGRIILLSMSSESPTMNLLCDSTTLKISVKLNLLRNLEQPYLLFDFCSLFSIKNTVITPSSHISNVANHLVLAKYNYWNKKKHRKSCGTRVLHPRMIKRLQQVTNSIERLRKSFNSKEIRFPVLQNTDR